jgi:hypothetical protein
MGRSTNHAMAPSAKQVTTRTSAARISHALWTCNVVSFMGIANENLVALFAAIAAAPGSAAVQASFPAVAGRRSADWVVEAAHLPMAVLVSAAAWFRRVAASVVAAAGFPAVAVSAAGATADSPMAAAGIANAVDSHTRDDRDNSYSNKGQLRM